MKKQSLKQLLKPLKLDYINADITDTNFPDTGERGKSFELMQYEKPMDSNEIINDMRIKGLRPATIYELLIWAKKNWDNKTYVISLGSVWTNPNGDRYVSYLDERAGKRLVHLHTLDHVWSGVCRFLAVRKFSQSLDTQSLGTSDSIALESLEKRVTKLEDRIERLKEI